MRSASAGDAAGRLDRESAFTEVDAVRPAGQGDVDTLVDHEQGLAANHRPQALGQGE